MNDIDQLITYFEKFIQFELIGVPIKNLTYFIGTFLFFIFFRNFLKKILISKFKFLFKKNIADKIKSIDKPLNFLIIGFGFFLSSIFLNSSDNLNIFLSKLNASIFTVFIFWIISQLIHPFFSNLKNIEKILTKDLIEWLIDAMRIVVLILGFCAVLELWGIRVGAIIAGLGLLGVAVALGAQDLFKNLISGILVLVEKRFKKGDVIEVDNVIAGVVEKIGFRSTAVRKFDKSLCYIPNNQFAENAVTNISQISNRRINWIIGLEYKSTSKQLKKICSEIEMVIKKNKKDFYVSENTQVIVKINEFSASSIDILVRCFTTSNDYNRLVEIKDKLAINIKDVVEKSGCSFAFPSQSLYIEKNQT